MKTVMLDKDGCTLLFLLMKETPGQRENTILNLGHPVFDTASGNVIYLNFPRYFGDEAEIGQVLEEMTKAQAQMAADLKLIPQSLVQRLGITSGFPARYVEIPAPNLVVSHRRQGYSEREDIPPLVIDWLEKLGHERGIHFQYQIGDLSY